MLIAICEAALFYLVYRFIDLSAAIIGLMVIQIIKLAFEYKKSKKITKSSLAITSSVIFIGGMTLLFDSPLFLQWKLTFVYLGFAIAILFSKLVLKFDILKNILCNPKLSGGNNFYTSEQTLLEVNFLWAIFFVVNSIINTWLIYNGTLDEWIEFKTFWTTGMLLVMPFATVFYFYIKMPAEEKAKLK